MSSSVLEHVHAFRQGGAALEGERLARGEGDGGPAVGTRPLARGVVEALRDKGQPVDRGDRQPPVRVPEPLLPGVAPLLPVGMEVADPADLAVLDDVRTPQSEPLGDAGRGRVVGVDVRDEAGDAGGGQPVRHRGRGLGGQPSALDGRRDHPGDLRRVTDDRGLDVADRDGVEQHHPVQPLLRAVGGVPDGLAGVAAGQLLERGRRTAGELVERRVARARRPWRRRGPR